MPDLPSYVWSKSERKFRDDRGRFVSRTEVRGALDTHLDAITSDIRANTQALVDGSITIDDWHERMEIAVKEGHVSAGAIAAGGWQQATSADWATVGRKVKFQYGKLRQFARELENGLPLDGSIVARAAMYGIAPTGTYEAVLRRGDIAAGFDLEKRTLHSGKPCRRCLAHAAKGWQPSGVLPGIGEDCDCLSNCRCTFERKRSVPRSRKARPMADFSDLRNSRQPAIEAARLARLAMFARGGGGTKSAGGKGGKAKAKSKGLGQGSAKGGKCCKTADGKFAKGNNYGSRGGGSGGSLKAGGEAGGRTLGSMIARTKAAAQAKAAANLKAEKLAARGGEPAAKSGRDRAVKGMVAKSKAASEAKSASPKSPTTASNVAARVAAAKAKQKAEVKASAAKAKPAPAASNPSPASKPAPKKASDPKSESARRAAMASSQGGSKAAREVVARYEKEAKADAAKAAQKQGPKPGSVRPRADKVERVLSKAQREIETARDSRGDARPRNREKDSRGRMTPEVAKTRADAAAKVKRARAVVAKLDTKQQQKLADQKARAEKRQAERPKLDLTKGDRAAAIKRATDKSRVASGKAGVENASRKRAAAEKVTTTRDKGSREDRIKALVGKASARKSALHSRAEAADKAYVTAKRNAIAAESTFAPNAAKLRAKADALGAKSAKAGMDRLNYDRDHKLKLAASGAKSEGGMRQKAASAAKAATAATKASRESSPAKPVTPVKPPPAAIESKPISDPVRLKAESSKMDQAFDNAPGARNNFVKLADLRKTMPHLTKDEFEAVVHKGQDDGKFGLETHEGLHGKLTPEEKDAAIVTRHGKDTLGAPVLRRWVYIQRVDR